MLELSQEKFHWNSCPHLTSKVLLADLKPLSISPPFFSGWVENTTHLISVPLRPGCQQQLEQGEQEALTRTFLYRGNPDVGNLIPIWAPAAKTFQIWNMWDMMPICNSRVFIWNLPKEEVTGQTRFEPKLQQAQSPPLSQLKTSISCPCAALPWPSLQAKYSNDPKLEPQNGLSWNGPQG